VALRTGYVALPRADIHGGTAKLSYFTEGEFYGGLPPNPQAYVIVIDLFLQYSLTLYLPIQPK
jgi:hypothetical protein